MKYSIQIFQRFVFSKGRGCAYRGRVAHGFNAKPGSATNFGMRVNELIRLPLPYGEEDCFNRDRKIGKKEIYNGHYSFEACEKPELIKLNTTIKNRVIH